MERRSDIGSAARRGFTAGSTGDPAGKPRRAAERWRCVLVTDNEGEPRDGRPADARRILAGLIARRIAASFTPQGGAND